MASEVQYNLFKTVFDDEITRHSGLESKAKLYLTIITFYLGIVGLKINEVVEFANRFQLSIILLAIMALVLFLALLFTIAAMSIRKYERICDLEEVIKSFGESPPKDNDILDDWLVHLAVATNRNALQNNRVATLLQCASGLIFMAVFLQLGIFLFAVVKSRM